MKVKSESEVAQSCLTGSDPMDCSPPGSSVHGIFQARVLEWGAIAFSASGGYLVIIPIHQESGKKGAGLSGQLIAGHVDQAKSQWAAGEVAAVLSFQSTLPPQQRPDLAFVSQPSGVFSQHLSGTRKD